MAKVSYKNSNNGDVITLDTENADDKRSADRIKGLKNWSRVDTPKSAPAAPAVKKPAAKASRAELLAFAKAHASDSEQGALEQMSEDDLRAFVDGRDAERTPAPAAGSRPPAAGPAAGV